MIYNLYYLSYLGRKVIADGVPHRHIAWRQGIFEALFLKKNYSYNLLSQLRVTGLGRSMDLQDENQDGELDDRRSLAWRVFFEASTRIQGILESRMKSETGMSLSDYNILLTLYESDGHHMRMGELCDHLGFSPPRMTYLVQQMIKDNWVTKIPSAKDGRGYDVNLTELGISVVEKATYIHQEIVRELILDDLTETHIDMIVDVFGHLDCPVN